MLTLEDQILPKDEVEYVVLVPHKNPDGDCLSSICLIRELLVLAGFPKEKIKYLKDCYGEKMAQLEWFKEMDIEHIEEDDIPSNSMCFVLDHQLPELSALKDWSNQKIRYFGFIDHHFSPTSDNSHLPRRERLAADLDQTAVSTTQVIYQMFRHYIKNLEDKELRSKLATLAFAGMYHDSGKFVKGIRGYIFDVMCELRSIGADIDKAGLFGYINYFNKEFTVAMGMRSCTKKKSIVVVDGVNDYKSRKYFSAAHFNREVFYSRLLELAEVKHVVCFYGEKHKTITLQFRTKDELVLNRVLIERGEHNKAQKYYSHTWIGLRWSEVNQILDLIKRIADEENLAIEYNEKAALPSR